MMSRSGIKRLVRNDVGFRAQVRLLDEAGIPWKLCPPIGGGHAYLLIGRFRWPIAGTPGPVNVRRVEARLRRWLRDHGLDGLDGLDGPLPRGATSHPPGYPQHPQHQRKPNETP